MALRRSPGLWCTVLVTACLEPHAPPERGLIVPPEYDDALISGAGGIAPAVLLEGGTGTHVVYVAEGFPDYGGPYPLAYAGCAGYCETASNWESGAFDSTLSTVPPAAAMTREALHVVYPVYGQGTLLLRYAACRAACTAPASWQRATIDSAVGPSAALIADSTGMLRATYGRGDATARTLRYSTCATDCTSAANWIGGTADTGLSGPPGPALAIEAGGRVHIAYTEPVAGSSRWRLRYGTCGAGCTGVGAWSFVTLDSGRFFPPSLVLRNGATAYLAYVVNDSVARIGRCSGACADPSSWNFASLQGLGSWPTLAVGPDGTMHLVGESPGRLKYGRCTAACDVPSDWVLWPLPVGTVSSAGLAVDAADHPRVAYALVFDALRMALFR